ncbi:MAG: glycoside hydrolase family 9 protein [Cyanobacteria bacterium J06606_4]
MEILRRSTDSAYALAGVVLLSMLPSCSAPLTTASAVDPARTAQTAIPEATQPKVSQVYAVSQNIIAIRFDAGQVIRGEQMSYERQPGDRTQTGANDPATWLVRNGKKAGLLIGSDHSIFYSLDQLVGEALDPALLQQTQRYRIEPVDAASSIPLVARARSITPSTLFFKSHPTDMARQDSHENAQWAMAHTVYLQLPQSLSPGQSYEIHLPESDRPPILFDYKPMSTHSEAVHVSHLGFDPQNPVKVGFLSTWMGTGGGLDYPEGLTFWLIDEATNTPLYEGVTQLSADKTKSEDNRNRNYNQTNVYRMDFSEVSKAGNYRLCVQTVGCSFPFEIASDVWEKAFYVSARGLYHQRSGIALTEPHTSYQQPRSFHPDDGVEVFQSTVSLMEVELDTSSDRTAFSALSETRTAQTLPEAWGGYFDAGDWDRNIRHLEAAQLLLELVDLFPDYIETLDLNLPESDNALPDVLDEALWGLDFFRRMQTETGGIRGGIDSAGHPKRGEASWQESYEVMAYAPDLWSSYIYAGVAAQAARLLQDYDPALANTYEVSALRAMRYAEQSLSSLGAAAQQALHHDVKDRRNFAAIALYQLSGDPKWHELFLATTVFHSADQPVKKWQQHDQQLAAFTYANLANQSTNPTVKVNARQALLKQADRMIRWGQQTAFHWTKLGATRPIITGNSFGNPKATPLLRAHYLTGQSKYLSAAILACQFSAGANPQNLVYTTGLGHRSPQNPLVLNQRVTGQAPPPGITVYGPLDAVHRADYWVLRFLEGVVVPSIHERPTTESYLDIFLYPAVTEFTIHQTIAPTAYAWGYLAAQ